MPRYEPITRLTHTGKKWISTGRYGFAGGSALTPLVAEELPRATRELVCAITKSGSSFELVAVLGLQPSTNLFVADDGRWIGNYTPASLRAFPFKLFPADSRGGFALAIDEESGLSDEGETFYDEVGKLSPKLMQFVEFLKKLEVNRQATGTAIAILAEHDLIEAWPLTVKQPDGQETKLAGLYRISEAKLNSLKDDAFLKLRHSGALPIAYMQLLSTRNIDILQRLSQARAAQAIHKPARAIELDFGEANDRDAKIDWSSFL